MKVLFLDTVHVVLEQLLTKANFTCIDATLLTKDECKKLVKDAAGIVVRSRFKIDVDFLKHAKQLKFIARSGAGMENIDQSYCLKRNISLFNAPEGNRNAVAEHALGMLLALFNNLNKAHQEIKNGIWDREGNRGIELDGKTVGIIGYGNNGSAFAKKLRGFDVQVLAYDKYKTDFGDSFVKEVELQTIFKQADVLSLHIPQNKETLFMVNDAFINAFCKTFFIYSILARGKIVNTAALCKALEKTAF
jgi:Phosphoglycerate dehydrogenase and related dehydrogenases